MDNNRIGPCRVCGHQVSEYAPACPNCGDPTARRYGHKVAAADRPAGGANPWKIIGWIVLGFFLLWMYSCMKTVSNMDVGAPSSASATSGSGADLAGPSYELAIVSVACEGGRYSKADITVRNTGTSAIPFAQAFFEFTDDAGKVVATGDSFFSPSTIPPGSTASTSVYASPNVDFARCRPSAVQDRRGNPATLREG